MDDLYSECKAVAYDAQRFHEWFKPHLENSAASKSAYAFKNRLKKANDIFSKVHAKRNHPDPFQCKPDYAPANVTDASGFRIVCLFNREIPRALAQIFDLIAVVGATSDGVFDEQPVIEIIYFSSQATSAPLSIYPDVFEVVKAKGLLSVFTTNQAAQGQRLSSYSSVHVIVEGHITEDSAPPFTARSEIQVRSVFEEAWSEITHRLKYGPAKRDRALGVRREPDSTDDRHLDALKSLTDGCAQYADLIDAQLERRDGAKRDPQSVELPKKLLEPFQQCDDAVRREIEAAYAVEEDAEKRPYDDAQKPEKFLAAGIKFSDARESLERSAVPTDQATRDRLIRLLSEEVGYCYMFSGNTELISKAEDIFQDVLSGDPNNAIVLVRLAQIKRDAEEFEPARELMERARAAIAAKGAIAGQERLAWLVGRDLAFICWKLVDVDRSRPDAVRLLERAVELSDAAIGVGPTEQHRLNAGVNLLYYYVDLVDRVEGQARTSIIEQARRRLAEITPDIDLEGWRDTYLDSVLRAERTFGDPQKARDLATVIVKRLRAKLAAERSDKQRSWREAFVRLTLDEQDMLLYAEEALASSEPPPTVVS
jgi:ppGpp synthetase/RelA/SpoT-type nucleotidyltranferase